MKKTVSAILTVLLTISCFFYTNLHSNAYAQERLTPIMEQSQTTKEQAFQLLSNNNSAKTEEAIQEFVDITWEEAAVEGVRADMAFSLMMLETGYLKFGGRVPEDYHNFGGIGATDDGGTPAIFNDDREGIRAVVQHLKAYASSDDLQNKCVDPRFHLVKRGCAQYTEWLGIQENPEGRGWASGYGYGYKIINIMNRMTGEPLIPVITDLTANGNYPACTITATASYANQALYKFTVLDTETGQQTVIQNYSQNNTATWTPNPGSYKIFAFAKKADSQYEFDSFTTCVEEVPPFTVVLDAGHGGIDPGAISSAATGSLREADLNEQLTRILGELLKDYGLNVIYTRDRITPRSSASYEAGQQDLHNRVDVANNAGADLFLSIHHNAFLEAIPENKEKNDAVKGIETYYSTNKQPGEAVEKSKILAKQTVDSMASLGFVNRGAKDSNFVVVKYTTMPAVLIEAGYMTNDYEVLRAANPIMQRTMAKTIADTLMDYFDLCARSANPNVKRIAGDDRYETAVKVSQAGWATAYTVILARGDDYADAVAGVPLAHQLNAPILITQTDSTVPAAMAEITRLKAERVIILGGPGAISDNAMGELKGRGLAVERIQGADRYETAVRIAERLAREGAVFDTAFLAVGTDFADALAASGYAAMRGQPILLTETNYLPQATKNAMTNQITNTVVCGGPAAVNESVFVQLPHPKRVYGSDRFLTALEMAKEFMPKSTENINVATGLDFPDAVAGGVLAAKNNSGVLLVQGNDTAPIQQIKDYLAERGFIGAVFFGGTAVISGELEVWFNNNLKK